MLTAGCRAAPATLINASVRAAYLAGVYDGFIPVGTLCAHGDFGLGAADRNGGELTMLDGRYYSARAATER
jgi:acetolactate decarboxylase